jgi:hypothetical protein
MFKGDVEIRFRDERPDGKITCRHENGEPLLFASFPPTERQQIHWPIDYLEETQLRPLVFQIRVEKLYPSAYLASHLPW